MFSAPSLARRFGLAAIAVLAVGTVAGCGSKSLVDNFTAKANASDFQAAGTVTGTVSVTIGDQKMDGTYSGTIKIKGKDSSSTMTMAIAGSTTMSDQVSVGDSDYTRTDGGSWTKTARSTSGLSVTSLIAGGVTDKGVEPHNGQQLHHLDPVKAVDAKSIFSDSNMASGSFTVVLWAKDDGTPAGLTIAGSWSQDSNGSPAQATLSLDFNFDTFSGVTIEAPSV